MKATGVWFDEAERVRSVLARRLFPGMARDQRPRWDFAAERARSIRAYGRRLPWRA